MKTGHYIPPDTFIVMNPLEECLTAIISLNLDLFMPPTKLHYTYWLRVLHKWKCVSSGHCSDKITITTNYTKIRINKNENALCWFKSLCLLNLAISLDVYWKINVIIRDIMIHKLHNLHGSICIHYSTITTIQLSVN